MPRRLAAALAATLAALCLTTTPAHANNPELDTLKTRCIDIGADAHACLDVYYHYLGGDGITINHVYLRISGGFWEHWDNAADCNNVRMWNNAGVVKWRKDGAECDVPENLRYHVFTPSVEMGQATSATVGWTFDAHLNSEPDVNGAHISITV